MSRLLRIPRRSCFSLAWVRRPFHVVDSFDEINRFPGHSFYSSGSCGNSRILGISAVWSTALESGERASASEWLRTSLYFCLFLILCLSQSVFATIQRRLTCPCANADTHQSRNEVKFCVAQFLRFCVSFSSFRSREGILHCCSQLRTCLADR